MIKINTNHGSMTLELDAEKAPVTVENFMQYVTDGHYNGTIFHRVIKGFMIQGGGMEAGMKEKPTRDPIKNEADNGLPNDLGTIAMARTNVPDSATSQFFINAKDNGFLNHTAPTSQGWGYCVFGKVVDGLNVMQEIEGVETGSAGMHQDVPVEDVIIESIEVIEAE